MIIDKLIDSTRVVSFGCSMVFGEELPDCTKIPRHPSEFAFASLIAKKYEKDYLCLAQPGNGNDAIFREIMNYVRNDYIEGDFLVIGWSGQHRREYFDKSSSSYTSFGPLAAVKYDWQNIKPASRQQFVKAALDSYKLFLENADDNELINEMINTIVATSGYLRNNHIPFFMCQSLWEINAYHELIPELVDMPEHYTDMSFMTRIFSNGGHFYPGMHPTLAGHDEWATELIEWISNV